MDLLYVVLEFADEDLSQVVPERALSPSETRDMIGPLLEALTFLHGKNFVHSHVSPANIHAVGDQLKLSCDTIVPIGDSRISLRPPEIYDAPESSGSPFAPPADVWGLGATLVEVLTQRAPLPSLDNQANPLFPDTIPQPFLEIVRHALRIDPKSRWTIAEIRSSLTPAVAAAAAGKAASPAAATVANSAASVAPAPVASAAASVALASPLAVPLSPVAAVPAAKLPVPKRDTPPPKPQAVRQQSAPARAPKQTMVLPNYVVPVLAWGLLIGAVIALPKILKQRSDASQTTSASAQPASQPSSPEPVSRRASTPPPVKPPASNSAKTAAERKSSEPKPAEPKSAEQAISSNAATPPPAPASLRTDAAAPGMPAKSSHAGAARGDVLDQVLPDVSDKARATIRGRVRVAVLAHVDAAGNVTDAEFESRGPSKYFADQALKAVRHWVFTAPEIDGRSAPSEWLIHFVFTSTETKASPTQTSP